MPSADALVRTKLADAYIRLVPRAVLLGMLVGLLRLKRLMLLSALLSPWLEPPSLVQPSKGAESVLLSLSLLGDIFENAAQRLARGVRTSGGGSALRAPFGDRKPVRQRVLGVAEDVDTRVSSGERGDCGMKASGRRELPAGAGRGPPALDMDVPLESLLLLAAFAPIRALAARRGLLLTGKSCLFCAASAAARASRDEQFVKATFVSPAGKEPCKKGSTAFARATAPIQGRDTPLPVLPLEHLGLRNDGLLARLPFFWEIEAALDTPLCGAAVGGRAACGARASFLPIACT